jgi:hypothetical protein
VPGSYTDVTVPSGQTCIMEDGLYYISGKVSFPGGGDLVGGNVTLYFTCAEPPACGEALAGTGSVTISGWDDTGAWNTARVSLLFTSDNRGHQHIGGGPVAVGGTIYAPGAELHVRDAQTIDAHRVVIDRLTIGPAAELSVNVPLATIEPSGFGLSR